jgi:hypothetical protein
MDGNADVTIADTANTATVQARAPLDGRVVSALSIMSLVIVMLAYFVYSNAVNGLRQSDIVIVDASQIIQAIGAKTTDMTPKEVADLITSAAEGLAAEGKIVIRREAAWGAPERNILHVEE